MFPFVRFQHLNGPSIRRVGFGQEKEVVTTIIPCDVDNLLLHYDVVEEAPSSSWDFVWNSVVEEGREKRLLSQCFTAQFDSIPSATFEMSDEDVLAETALKVSPRSFLQRPKSFLTVLR